MSSMQMRRLALVIGINAYPAPQTPLHGCVGDARRVGHFLLSARGGSFAKVIPLMDRYATLGNIRQVLRRASNEQWDQVVVYFAGHGSQEGIQAWDKLLRFQELAPAITSIPALHHLLILDACYSGAVHEYFGIDGIGGLEKYGTADAARIYMELLRKASPGLRVITAVDRNTTSLELNEEGLFTTALLRAAMNARPDLGPWGVSAGQVLTHASWILDEQDAPLPLWSGELDDFPLAVTDSLHRLGSIDAESTWVRWAQPDGRPAELHFGFSMDISGRKLMPVWVQHELREDLGARTRGQ